MTPCMQLRYGSLTARISCFSLEGFVGSGILQGAGFSGLEYFFKYGGDRVGGIFCPVALRCD